MAAGSPRDAVSALWASWPGLGRLRPYNPRMNDTILRRIDGSVIVAALATVPLVVLDARGIRVSWLVAANWAVWLVLKNC